MTNREITIGRDRRCDIILDESCIYASSRHASLYLDGNQLMYRDYSRNGSMVNNVRVHNRTVPVQYGDYIMIASSYPLSWNQILLFFPDAHFPHKQRGGDGNEQNCSSDSVLPNLGWNWGAFMLYPFWGFVNGCWWAFLIWLFFWWSFIPNLLFGALGSKWAWANGNWNDASDFNSTQESWRPWGIAFFVLSIIGVIFTMIFWGAVVATLFGSAIY